MINYVMKNMIKYYEGDPKRIQHFIKVHSFCKFIGECESLSQEMLQILEVSGYVHDIGIKVGEAKYGTCTGKIQEEEGPAVAREMLMDIGFDEALIDRVCFIIANHHSYDNIVGQDYQILVEADFLVNIYESSMPSENIQAVRDNIFKTKTGLEILDTMFFI